MSTTHHSGNQAEPTAITVQVLREVDTQASQGVASWVNAGQRMMESFPGYLGSGFLQSKPESNLWRMIYRFDTPENLRRWEESEERSRWSHSFSQHIRAETSHQRTGVEGWFDTHIPHDHSQELIETFVPPRWKQMVVIFCGFYPMTMLANILLGSLLPPETSTPIKVTLAVFMVMPLMVYFILPFMTRLFSPWLNKR